MDGKITIKIKPSTFLSRNIFGIINLVTLASLAVPSIKAGIMSSLCILLCVVLNINQIYYILKTDHLFSIYIIYSLLSGFFYIYNGRPISIYVASISYMVIPSMLYWIGARCVICGDEVETTKKLLNVIIFMLAFGLTFYTFMPDFYYEHIGQSLDTHSYGIYDYRYGSYISSLNLGSLCVASIAIIAYMWNQVSFTKKTIAFVLTVISLVLSMQRGAWIAGVIILVVAVLLTKVSTRKKSVIIILISILLLLIFSFRTSIFTPVQLNIINTRLGGTKLSQMTSTRNEQWSGAVNIFLENPWGFGVGSLSHKAAPYGLSVINDGNYLRILAELGLVGIVSFSALCVRAIIKCVRTKEYSLLLILLGFYMMAIGSNVFDLFFSSFIFWFFLGYATYIDKKGCSVTE